MQRQMKGNQTEPKAKRSKPKPKQTRLWVWFALLWVLFDLLLGLACFGLFSLDNNRREKPSADPGRKSVWSAHFSEDNHRRKLGKNIGGGHMASASSASL